MTANPAPVLLIALLWIAFAGGHLLLSSARVRPRLVDRLGEGPFAGLYSLVALGTFVPLVWVFATHKHAGPLLWTTLGPPTAVCWVNHLLMAAALALVVCALLPGSTPPSAMQAQGPPTVRGIVRITRHPTLTGFALFGLAHLLVNGSLGDVLFFSGFVLFAWAGARHQDGRKLRERPGYDEVMATTSVVPFAAILAGRQRLESRELPVAGIAVALALTVVLRAYHGALFGP